MPLLTDSGHSFGCWRGDSRLTLRAHRLEASVEAVHSPHWIKSKNPNAPAVKREAIPVEADVRPFGSWRFLRFAQDGPCAGMYMSISPTAGFGPFHRRQGPGPFRVLACASPTKNGPAHSTVTPLALIGPVHFSISLRTK